jgi:ACR3 family arsenite transporter
MTNLRDIFETQQIKIYFAAVMLAALLGLAISATTALRAGINPALAFMLFVTFLQVPLSDLGRAFLQIRFLIALLITNFIAVPILVYILMLFLPPDPIVRLGALLALLTPCIDYVVTFAHLGRGDAKLLLISTPVLLILQMLLLPIYLGIFLGDDAATLVHLEPFIHAFIWMIAIPLVLTATVQLGSAHITAIGRASRVLDLLPVPATALVLFIVIAALVPQLGLALNDTLSVIPIYITYAVMAPLIGWGISRLVRLDAPAGRAIAFSAGTRNSLVVLPFAFAVPNAIPLLPAIIVAQTFVELISELVYIRIFPKLGKVQSHNSILG